MLRHLRAYTFGSVVALLWWAAGCLPQTGTSFPRPGVSSGSADPGVAEARDDLGVLVMAHGGGAEWNENVGTAVTGLRERVPLAVAFGMANPRTLQTALDSLHARGANSIAVVRLFLSGASFLHQTEFLFGLRPDPPARAMMGDRMVAGSELAPLKTGARVLLDMAGMAGSEHVNRIVLARADATSPDPATTGVLLIAHGMGAEDENQRLLDAMENTATGLRSAGYGEVQIATLREDWAEPRADAEQEIRATVAGMGEQWNRVVVIPYRTYGFGPYAEVLDGLDYVSTGGLLPHRLVGDWIATRASTVFCLAGIVPALGPCPVVVGSRSSVAQTTRPTIEGPAQVMRFAVSQHMSLSSPTRSRVQRPTHPVSLPMQGSTHVR